MIEKRERPIPGVAPPNVTDAERIACSDVLLKGTDFGAAVSIILDCGSTITVIGRRLPTGILPSPEDVAQAMGQIYGQLAKLIENHDFASTMSVGNVVCTVDHATGAVETETREEFDAKQRKAAH